MTEKRIAIQLFGHMRTFADCYQSLIDKVINPNKPNYKIDIFIHTWNCFNDSNTRGNYTNETLTKPFDEIIKSHIKKIYSPCEIIFDVQQNIQNRKIKHLLSEKEGTTQFIDSQRLYNMYYSMYKSNLLRKEYEQKNNVKYDFIIQTRPDIIFFQNLDLDSLIDASRKRKYIFNDLKSLDYKNEFPVFIAFWADFPSVASVEPSSVWASDLLLISTPENMNKINSLAPNLNNLLDADFWNQESFFTGWIKSQDIKIQLIPFILGRDFNIKLYDAKDKKYLLMCFFYTIINLLMAFQVKKFKKSLLKYLKMSNF